MIIIFSFNFQLIKTISPLKIDVLVKSITCETIPIKLHHNYFLFRYKKTYFYALRQTILHAYEILFKYILIIYFAYLHDRQTLQRIKIYYIDFLG